MRNGDVDDLDMVGQELYHRRLFELTLFGAMSEEQAHEWALRFARGNSVPPAPDHSYPDDYAAPPRPPAS